MENMKNMKKLSVFIVVFLLFALPAFAETKVVFDPKSAEFADYTPLAEQAASVAVSISDGTEIKAIRFGEAGSLSNTYEISGLILSSDISEDGAKLVFSGNIPSGYRIEDVLVYFFSDEEATGSITEAVLRVRISSRYEMFFDDSSELRIIRGEPVDVNVKITFDDNMTGEENLVLPLKSLALVPGSYEDLGLAFTPDAASSTIRITSNGAKLGSEMYYFAAESDSGSIRSGGLEVSVVDRALSFSAKFLRATVGEEADLAVEIEKKPANLSLADFDIVVRIEDSDDETDVVSGDDGVVWHNLAIDVDKDLGLLTVKGKADVQKTGEVTILGWEKGSDRTGEPDLESDELALTTEHFAEGDVLDVSKLAITDSKDQKIGRMRLDTPNLLTIPVSNAVFSGLEVLVYTPSGIAEQVEEVYVTGDENAAAAAGAADTAKSIAFEYTPREFGDYVFEVIYGLGNVAYYQDMVVGAGQIGGTSSGSSGCDAGFGALALFASFASFASFALGAAALRRKD